MGKTSNAPDVVEKKDKIDAKPYPTKSDANLSSYCFCVNIVCFCLTIFSVGVSTILWFRISVCNEQMYELDARIAKIEARRFDILPSFNVPYDRFNKRIRRDVSTMRASQRYGRQAAALPTPSECTCPPGNFPQWFCLFTGLSCFLTPHISCNFPILTSGSCLV